MRHKIKMPEDKYQSRATLHLDDISMYAVLHYPSGNYKLLRPYSDKNYMLDLLRRLTFTDEQKILFKEIIEGVW
jgi:hypothetical protein